MSASALVETKGNILIVDDDIDICRTLEEIIKIENFRVSVAHSGLDALDMVEKGEYDWILLDIRMPGIDGMETLKRILEKNRDQNVAIMTGYFSSEVKKEAMENGARAVLGKPMKMDDLFKIVNSGK